MVDIQCQGVHTYRGRVDSYGNEKGVDASLAIDLVHATHERHYDHVNIVSQSSHFVPAVDLAKEVASKQGRNIILESAFPATSADQWGRRNKRDQMDPDQQGLVRLVLRPH